MSSLFSMPASLAEGRSFLEINVPASRRKQLRQCFTGLRTGSLLAALAVCPGQRCIADPMAGHGDLLEAAAERASRQHFGPDELMGVEIEPEAARLGRWRIERCVEEFGVRQGRFIHGNAFAPATWDDPCRFDLVITNPPYVRYQTLSNGSREGDVKLLNAEETRQALEKLAVKLALPEEYPIWRRLIRSYSGLADLSVPSWLLCGLLTASSGVLALVAPQTWLNRDYACIARYFFLRFFQPLAIVQESGQRWFREALVPVSLVVGRRLPTEQAITPLRERHCAFDATPFAEIGPTAASERSHVGNSFSGDDPEGAFAEWLENSAGSVEGINLKRISWESQREEAISGARGHEWLRRLEGESSAGIVTVSSSTSALSASVASLLPSDFLNHTQPLACEPIRVGQGLRTGCNAFFYVDLVENVTRDDLVSVLTSDLFGKRLIKVPVSALKPVLRRQAEISGIRIIPDTLRGRLLDLRGFVLPENSGRNRTSTRSHYRIMPEMLAGYVRLAARTYLVRGETRTLIPDLSAVKPNGLGPDEADKVPSLTGDEVVRMWYMVPDFAPRHFPSLCVPRIIHDEPNAILNAKPPVLIDANFSTIWCEGGNWTAEDIFVIMNSTWGELCMEALGATLGGGALKLEATHLRQLPFPVFSYSQREDLRNLAREAIDSARAVSEFQNYRPKIDRVILSALTRRKISLREVEATVGRFVEIIHSLRAKRRRSQTHRAVEG